MSEIGPQRAAPKSMAAVKAEYKQLLDAEVQSVADDIVRQLIVRVQAADRLAELAKRYISSDIELNAAYHEYMQKRGKR